MNYLQVKRYVKNSQIIIFIIFMFITITVVIKKNLQVKHEFCEKKNDKKNYL